MGATPTAKGEVPAHRGEYGHARRRVFHRGRGEADLAAHRAAQAGPARLGGRGDRSRRALAYVVLDYCSISEFSSVIEYNSFKFLVVPVLAYFGFTDFCTVKMV